MPPPVLVLRGVAKRFRAGVPGCAASVVVLSGADLVLRAGERAAIVGPRGSGKSTLLLLAAGLLLPDAGEAWRLPGAQLSHSAPAPPRRLAVRVREAAPWLPDPPRLGPDRLAWTHRAAGGAVLVEVPAGAPVPPWATRVLTVERGRVRAVARGPGRVASVPGAP
jgi:energy-coupling factor transporter ATP-binding protein EcfA2